MNEPEDFLKFVEQWKQQRSKPLAIICDIDDTICKQFDVPIPIACEVLRALSRTITVHYVTARPKEARKDTEEFMQVHRLPGWQNLYFCPSWQSSADHKKERMKELAKEWNCLVSIGDANEDEEASQEADVPFVRVTTETVEQSWQEVRELLAEHLSE